MSMPKRDQCSCCFDLCLKVHLKPRQLIELPATTMGLNKRRQYISVYACEFCDTPPPVDNVQQPGVVQLATRGNT